MDHLKIYLVFIIMLFANCKTKEQNKEPDIKLTNITVTDPLPSWNDGPLKKDILAFVTNVTTEGNAEFIPVENRIATFDNDGTLWSEVPLVQGVFAVYQLKKMVTANPALAKEQP